MAVSKSNSAIVDRILACDDTEQQLLDLSKLNLENLPSEMLQVPKIKVLLAFKNRLTVVPTMSTFVYLEELNLSRNLLVNVGEYKLSGLHNLKILDLSRNQLESLPNDISKLPILHTLLIHRNKLTQFPETFGTLRSLTSIDASYNNLTIVSEALDNLPLLANLNITNNEHLDEKKLSDKCKRLVSLHHLLTSRAERRALINRCLGVDEAVRRKIYADVVEKPMTESALI